MGAAAAAEVSSVQPACDMPAAFFEEIATSVETIAAESSEGGPEPRFEVACADAEDGLRVAITLSAADGRSASAERVVSRASALPQIRAMARELFTARTTRKEPSVKPEPRALQKIAAPAPPKEKLRTVRLGFKLDLHGKLSSGAGVGTPDMFGPTMSLFIPNVLEIEGGVGWAVFTTTSYYIRAGFPWRVVPGKDLGWNLFIVPKIGYRNEKTEEFDLLGGCGSGCSGSHSGESRSEGLNMVVSLEPTVMLRRHFGLFMQYTLGLTVVLDGYSETVYTDDGDDSIETKKAGGVAGDFKIAIGFVF